MGRISKKEQVMNAIGGWISSGRYKAGMQLPTEQELMREFGVGTICFNWMAHVGWLRTRTDFPERGGATVTAFDLSEVAPPENAITAQQLWNNYSYFIKAVLPDAEKYGIRITVIDKEGNVLGESRGAGELMDNHLDREEVQKALQDSGKMLPWRVVTISTDGRVLEER